MGGAGKTILGLFAAVIIALIIVRLASNVQANPKNNLVKNLFDGTANVLGLITSV